MEQNRLVRPLATASLLVLIASPAAAWPVDAIHDVPLGQEKFVRLARIDWLEVEDPEIAEAEWMKGSAELLLTGKKPGGTLLLLAAEGRMAVWRLWVGARPRLDAAPLAAAEKACPGLSRTPGDDVKLRVHLRDEACRQALLSLLETDAFEARHLELLFEPTVLQEQLRRLSDALKQVSRSVKARYVGAGLIVEGSVSELEQRRTLWEVFRRTVGRVALDDRLAITRPDGGAAPE